MFLTIIAIIAKSTYEFGFTMVKNMILSHLITDE